MKALVREFNRFFKGGTPFDYMAKGYSPHLIKFLVREMQIRGMSVEDALADSDISSAELELNASRFSALQILQIVTNSLRLTPGIALDVGANCQVVACGIYGYAMLSSPDRLYLINVITRYAHLIDPLNKVEYLRRPGQSVWQFEPHLTDDVTHPLYMFAAELKVASAITVARDLYGPQFVFDTVRLRYQAPDHAVAYTSCLQCPVEYGQEVNQIVFSDANAVLQAISRPDPVTHALALELCEQEAMKLRTTVSQAEAVASLLNRSSNSFPCIEKVASDLLLHPRTLRRRLKAEGTSFREIVHQHRLQLAIRYLNQNALSNEEIAAQLGYSDASNFRKAFVTWTGDTPNSFRPPNPKL